MGMSGENEQAVDFYGKGQAVAPSSVNLMAIDIKANEGSRSKL
jgi:hypothetical protein